MLTEKRDYTLLLLKILYIIFIDIVKYNLINYYNYFVTHLISNWCYNYKNLKFDGLYCYKLTNILFSIFKYF